MNGQRKLPIGIQDFEKLRREGYIYVDKTEKIANMITSGCYYFLSRPRRFGKSLLMSTIGALFSGKKDLFDGTVGPKLAIADKIAWGKYPVLHLDLNTQKYDSPEALISVLNENLVKWEKQYGRSDEEVGLGRRFQGIISRAAEKLGKKTVVLIDEYDKPLLQAIGNPELQEDYRNILKSFYGALKSMDGSIQLALMTGVTKFGKVSVFSDLNNLNDISMDAEYWDICGMTEEELQEYFKPEIETLASSNQITYDKCVDTLRQRYDGYHFEETVAGVYNPFSVLCTLSKKKFGNYWFETGTPSYLVYLLQKHNYNLQRMATCSTSAKVLDSIDSNSTNPIPVIYQSGYLTIKGYNERFKTYTLGFPNKEVEEGFIDYLLPFYTSVNETDSAFCIQQFVTDIEEGKTEQFLNRLKSLFADTPYEIIKDLENHYQNVIWIVAKLMGFYVKAEYHTSQGRIDLVLQTSKYCYVMEFKLDGTAEEALRQIEDKQYVLPFELNCQEVIRIGLNFSADTRNIEKFVIQPSKQEPTQCI